MWQLETLWPAILRSYRLNTVWKAQWAGRWPAWRRSEGFLCPYLSSRGHTCRALASPPPAPCSDHTSHHLWPSPPTIDCSLPTTLLSLSSGTWARCLATYEGPAFFLVPPSARRETLLTRLPSSEPTLVWPSRFFFWQDWQLMRKWASPNDITVAGPEPVHTGSRRSVLKVAHSGIRKTQRWGPFLMKKDVFTSVPSDQPCRATDKPDQTGSGAEVWPHYLRTLSLSLLKTNWQPWKLKSEVLRFGNSLTTPPQQD